MELGVVLDSIAKITKTLTSTWLDSQIEVYNSLHAYNIAKTVAFPNDPAKLKCYVPTRINLVEPMHGAMYNCNILDDDTLIFRFGGLGSPIINTYTISTEESSDDITPESSFSVISDSYGTSQFFKTTAGYAWVSLNSLLSPHSPGQFTVQYSNDNFVTITTMPQYAFSSNSRWGSHGAIQDGDKILLNYLKLDYRSPTYLGTGLNQNKIVDVEYDTVAGTSTLGTELNPSFTTSFSGYGGKMNIDGDNVFIKQFGDYSLIYGSYGYKTGYFLVDLTNTDPYWYYFDPILFGMYRRDKLKTTKIWMTYPESNRNILDIRKIGSIFYFIFGISNNTLGTSFSDFNASYQKVVVYKMETV